jgi:ferredoxin
MAEMGFVRSFMEPWPECDREKCARCAICVKKWSYKAIEMNPDIEDGYPVFNRAKCQACVRCLNKCPREAIEVPDWGTQTRSRYRKANIVPAGQKCEDGMISQPFPHGLQLNTRAFYMVRRNAYVMLVVLVMVLAMLIGMLPTRK